MIISIPVAAFFLHLIYAEVVLSANFKSKEFPVIEYRKDEFGRTWKNTTEGLDNIHFYSEKGDDFAVDCKAKYPIKWTVRGIIVPQDVVRFSSPERNLSSSIYTISVSIFFLDAEQSPELIASADLICEKLDDPAVHTTVTVAVTGARNKTTLLTKFTEVKNSKLIPCYTTDPSTPTLLFRQIGNGRSEEMIRNVKYVPSSGFYSNDGVFNGNYVCRKSTEFVRISAITTPLVLQSDYTFSPDVNVIRVFSEESINIKCASKTKAVHLRHEDNANLSMTTIENDRNKKAIMITNTPQMKPGSRDFTKSRAACFIVDGSAESLLYEWELEFYATPELHLNNFEGEADCLTAFPKKRIQTVRCRNHIDCQFMTSCLGNPLSCNYKKQKQFFATTSTFCYILALKRGSSCVSVPYSHYHGLAHCSILDGLMTKTWEFFVSLDLLKYNNWMEAPLSGLVRMDELPSSILYTNRTTQFNCVATAFLFTRDLMFELEYKNGTRHFLETEEETPDSDLRKIDEFNIVGTLSIFLPIDAVAVHCHALWWNSSDTLWTTRKFETRHLLYPTIENHEKLAEKAFYTEEKRRKLTCSGRGEPQPKYQWLFRKSGGVNTEFQNALNVFPELKISQGSNGESYLEFPVVRNSHRGEYKCIAENSEGQVEKKYVVKVSDEPVSGKSVIYIVVFLVIFLLLLIVAGALFVFMKRYKEAQALVRSLTDSEIDEFFQGKPELLSNATNGYGHSQPLECIDFLPYKREYELSLDDIEFDQSGTSFLGSGEFSYVVKGTILSKSKLVAVKISKPTADVALFKSLLSEVKIMIYIGHHENIVTLVGVCTESIRNRSIHIATEICEFGSLENYLRKARPNFVNLIDENQQIDKSLLPDGNTNLSTLDLIHFSSQIANGMEYLAFKCVIHADLAARNVLLTTNHETASKICKISDFGLSKKLYESNNYTKKTKTPLPWRWMPPESLNTMTFSSQSDVWSYGATLYEIFTLGDIPFPNEEWNTEFLTRLASGMRMGRPRYSTADIYSKIVACWEHEPEQRPKFETIRSFFELLVMKYNETKPNQPDAVVKAEATAANAVGAKHAELNISSNHENSDQESIYANCNELQSAPCYYTNLDEENQDEPKGNATPSMYANVSETQASNHLQQQEKVEPAINQTPTAPNYMNLP